jgi:uncharacterized membrane protein YkoI
VQAQPGMILVRSVLTGLIVLCVGAALCAADAADRCLAPNEQKAKTAAHAVVPLSRAMRAVKSHGEIIHALLCEQNGRLVYLLTVLGRDGKVGQASVDAANGSVMSVHGQDDQLGIVRNSGE